jgi:DNA-binding FadR family transcriptional regulator
MSSREGRLYERVADHLRADIGGGKYRLGERIPSERDLAHQFKISRPTIREAIFALEADGLVEVRTNSGVYVVSLSVTGPSPVVGGVGGFEVLEARRLIESQVAALAATLIDDATVARLRSLVHEMESSSLLQAEVADREFHIEIARATGNSALEATVATLWDTRSQSPQYRILTEKVRSAGVAPRESEHARIVNAFAANDPAAAQDAMWDHLTRVIESLLEATETEAIERARAEVEGKRRRMHAAVSGSFGMARRD